MNQHAAWGREGGKARTRNFEGRLLERLAALPFKDAVLTAYRLGRRNGYEAAYSRKRRRGREYQQVESFVCGQRGA